MEIRNIKIIVKSLGPVENAEIDIPLNGITAIIGPTASGKTYLAEATFMAMELFQIGLLKAYALDKHQVSEQLEGIIDVYMGSDFKSDATIQLIQDDGSRLEAFIHGDKIDIRYTYNKELLRYVEKYLFTRPSMESVIEELTRYARSSINVSEDIIKKIAEKIMEVFVRGTAHKALIEYVDKYREFLRRFSTLLTFGSVAYVPAERIALITLLWPITRDVMHFYTARMLYEQGPSYPKPLLLRYLATLIELLKLMTPEVVDGISKLVNIKPIFNEKDLTLWFEVQKLKLAPQHVSTGALQLTGLMPFLFNKRFKILVIEEPEINLHADKQLEIADMLWDVSDKSILITTHSDFLIMRLAKNSRRKPIRSFKPYILLNGRTRELKVDEDGHIEEIETIAKTIDELLKS